MNLSDAQSQARRHADAAIEAGRIWSCNCQPCRAFRSGNFLRLRKSTKRISGHPVSITLTVEQRLWLHKQIPDGGTLTAVVRGLIEDAMKKAD